MPPDITATRALKSRTPMTTFVLRATIASREPHCRQDAQIWSHHCHPFEDPFRWLILGRCPLRLHRQGCDRGYSPYPGIGASDRWRLNPLKPCICILLLFLGLWMFLLHYHSLPRSHLEFATSQPSLPVMPHSKGSPAGAAGYKGCLHCWPGAFTGALGAQSAFSVLRGSSHAGRSRGSK